MRVVVRGHKGGSAKVSDMVSSSGRSGDLGFSWESNLPRC